MACKSFYISKGMLVPTHHGCVKRLVEQQELIEELYYDGYDGH